MDERPPLGPAPRAVPPSLRLRVLLGGLLPTIGFAILAIAGSMAMAFVSHSELMTVGRFSGELWTAEGVVTAVERLPIQSNDRTVCRVDFRYEVDRRELNGSCYDDESSLQPGAEVIVEHVASAPEIARIRGMRTAPFPVFVSFVLVFPLVGLGLVIGGVLANRRRVRLLRDGESAWAVLTDRKPTSTRVNNQRVYALEFTFVAADGQRRTAHERTHRAVWFDEQVARPVLYDPHSRAACLVEMTPGKPQVVDGNWAPASPLSLLAVLLLPTLAVLGNWVALTI